MVKLTYKLSAYEGPIDLLYQLIQANELDIFDIPVAELADQYLEFLDSADSRDMESMSEFAYMAATLLEIKSRILLPRPSAEKEDPRKELVDQLLEYRRMKLAAEMFVSLEDRGAENFFKRPEALLLASLKPKETIDDIIGDISIADLYRVFKDVMGRRELKVDKIRSSFKAVSKDLFTVEDKMDYILSLLTIKRTASFFSLIDECDYKMEMVVSFLAVLELIKKAHILVYQNEAFSDIKLVLKNEL